MCTNYAPLQARLLRDIFGVEPPPDLFPDEAWPDYAAPIVQSDPDGTRRCVLAAFGMVPRSRIGPGAPRFDSTNARSETVGERPAFRRAWRDGQLCLIPMSAFYEPNYENGPKSVRWRVWVPGQAGFAVAGLWRAWPEQTGTPTHSFTMLTVNADSHPLMRRMHAPGKEKRSIVIIPEAEWTDWLTCREPERARLYLRLFPAEAMAAEPAPLPPRTRSRGTPPPDSDGGGTASLF